MVFKTDNTITVRILLLVAKMFADPQWKSEIETLITHIKVNGEHRE